MSGCPNRTYPLNAAQAMAICQKIAVESGIHIDPTQPTGSAETHGVQINWIIQGNAITISIPSKPWVIPCSTILDELDNLLGVTSA